MAPTRSFGLLLALLSALTFSTSGPFAHALLGAGWTAPAAVATRVGVAALVLAVPAAIALRGRWGAVRRDLTGITLFGVLGVGAAQVGFFNAIRYLPVGVALLLEYLGVVLVVFWMWAAHGQRPRALTTAGAVTAVVGLVLVLDLSGGARLSLVGVAWGLFAGVGLASYFVLGARETPEGVEGVPPLALATAGMAIGALVLLVLGATGLLPMHATFGQVTLGDQRMSWLVPVAGLSLVAAVVAYVAGIAAARALGARLSSFVGLTEVLFAVLVSWLVLDELPTTVQIAGGALIVAGVALVRLDERRPAEALASA
ncbi:Threonine/homoserine efflux transporter RhtA [Asanoa hainanensis]|uniref:Threonine/homoserine efflux transporter RhtA n=2 Tax=Asanoa hainanensis TaxID=560556 RepID=A0A239FS80_9ACTN|nr:EamA family transporter [Asanoa hainanensis]SNS59635.1 Threonine/homoserine efflux transporter RhtA [Asanoa hainanensis]